MRFFFTQTDHDDQIWGSTGSDWARRMGAEVVAAGDARYELVDDPEAADIILFWEAHQDSQVIWAPRLRAHPLIHRYPNKAFVVWMDDAPLGFLPGVYTSLPARLFDRQRHRTWIYHQLQNPHVEAMRGEVRQPRHLASFSGAYTHHVRAWLLEKEEAFAPENVVIRKTARNQFAADPHAPEVAAAQREYVELMLASKFSLCPRGNGTGSFRVQESMALGRAPVIISDEWVPPPGPRWREFALFVGENDIRHIPKILRDHEGRWEEMGEKAREAYERFFRPAEYALHVLAHICTIHRHRRHDERAFIERWGEMIAAERRHRRLD